MSENDPDLYYYAIYNKTEDGRYVVFLGGINYNNCTTDRDCPPSSVCYHEASWSAFPRQCACWNYDQLGGYRCLDPIATPDGLFSFVSQIVIATTFSLLILYSLATAIFACRRNPSFFARVTVLNTTLLFAFLTSVFMVTKYILATMPYAPFYDAEGRLYFRSISVNTATLTCFLLSYFFNSLTLLNLSLVWLKTLSSTVMPTLDAYVSRYTALLLTYYVVSLILTSYYTYASPNRAVANSLSLAAIVYSVVTYVLVWWRLDGYMREHGRMMNNNEELRAQLTLISRTALAVSGVGVCLGAMMIGFFASGASEERAPFYAPSRIFIQLFNGFSACLIAIILRYVWLVVETMHKWESRRGKVGGESGKRDATINSSLFAQFPQSGVVHAWDQLGTTATTTTPSKSMQNSNPHVLGATSGDDINEHENNGKATSRKDGVDSSPVSPSNGTNSVISPVYKDDKDSVSRNLLGGSSQLQLQ